MLGGIAGGFVGALVYIVFLLTTPEGISIGSAKDILLVSLPGLLAGICLGALFPKPFFILGGWILQLFP